MRLFLVIFNHCISSIFDDKLVWFCALFQKFMSHPQDNFRLLTFQVKAEFQPIHCKNHEFTRTIIASLVPNLPPACEMVFEKHDDEQYDDGSQKKVGSGSIQDDAMIFSH